MSINSYVKKDDSVFQGGTKILFTDSWDGPVHPGRIEIKVNTDMEETTRMYRLHTKHMLVQKIGKREGPGVYVYRQSLAAAESNKMRRKSGVFTGKVIYPAPQTVPASQSRSGAGETTIRASGGCAGSRRCCGSEE